MNFLCISHYNNNLEWLNNYNNPHIIYDKTCNGGYIDNNESFKIAESNLKSKYPNLNIVEGNINGYNIYDYMTFIIDNYDKLPEVIVFMKANTINRHITKESFDKIINNDYFTCIEDWKFHALNQKSILNGNAMISCEGGWLEKNTSWYLNHPKHPTKYFISYNDFLNFCYKDPVIPKFIRFPPGGNYIVPKSMILKYDKVFYENLRVFTSHSRVPGEGQLIERALFTIWNCNYEVSENMKHPIDNSFDFPKRNKLSFRNMKYLLKRQLYLSRK